MASKSLSSQEVTATIGAHIESVRALVDPGKVSTPTHADAARSLAEGLRNHADRITELADLFEAPKD